jgi:hypothetical protein
LTAEPGKILPLMKVFGVAVEAESLGSSTEGAPWLIGLRPGENGGGKVCHGSGGIVPLPAE